MFVPRVTLPSQSGEITVILDGDAHWTDHDIVVDSVNRNNILLLRCCWMSLLADSPFDRLKPKHVILAFAKKLYNVRQLIAEFATLGDKVMKSEQIEDGRVTRAFIPEMRRTPIFREYYYWWRTGDPHALTYVLGFLKYGKKLSIVDESLHTTALRGWMAVEDRLGELELPPFVDNLRTVCRWLFSDFKLEQLYPAHGGGSVAETGVHGVNAKNERLTLSKKVWNTYFRRSIFNYTETGDYGLPDHRGYVDLQDHAARLMFVPKDYKTSRSICMEPIGYQFAQQGVLWYFEQYLKQSRISSFVDLERQEYNQQAAQYGSFTGQVDTIDLSSASDSVAWALIKAIMPSSMLRHLHATRSTMVQITQPDGSVDVVKPHKFAPMGSALCFPTQCCVFTAVVITIAMIQSLGRDWNDPTALVGVDLDGLMNYSFGKMGRTTAGRFEPPQIYGDDICLDHRLTSNTVEALTALGFVVNIGKSFTGADTFRESCGKYYSRGHDVSFILHSVKPLDEERVSIETLASVIDLANRAGEFGYATLRSTLINFALRHKFPGVAQSGRQKLNPVLFTEDKDETFAILTRTANIRNNHLRRRSWKTHQDSRASCCMFQRNEIQSISSGPYGRIDWDIDYENYSYTIWWRSQRRRGDELRITQSLSRADRLWTTARFRWTQT